MTPPYPSSYRKVKARRPFIQQPDDPSYRFISLTKGQHAIVDTELYEWLMGWNWYAHWDQNTKSFRADTHVRDANGKFHNLTMHRLIMGLEYGDKTIVDHVNHDTLDNRRFINGEEQLRIVTNQQNCTNQKIRSNNKSGYKGVYFHKRLKRWHASIRVDGKRKSLGFFDTPELAYVAYCKAAELYHGKFAYVR